MSIRRQRNSHGGVSVARSQRISADRSRACDVRSLGVMAVTIFARVRTGRARNARTQLGPKMFTTSLLCTGHICGHRYSNCRHNATPTCVLAAAPSAYPDCLHRSRQLCRTFTARAMEACPQSAAANNPSLNPCQAAVAAGNSLPRVVRGSEPEPLWVPCRYGMVVSVGFMFDGCEAGRKWF